MFIYEGNAFYIQPSLEQTRLIIHVHIFEATAHLCVHWKMKFRHQTYERDLNGGGYVGLYVIQDYMVERCTGGGGGGGGGRRERERDRQTDRQTDRDRDRLIWFN